MGENESGLTYEQLTFILAHEIPLDRLFDATGMKRSEYKRVMGEQDLLVAYGTTPCKSGGHTLRSRHGHCLQCDTSKVAYALRGSKAGWLYLANSDAECLVKVGVTSDPESRAASLRAQRYGGASDWDILASFEVEGAGRLEAEVHRALAHYSVPGTYTREGRTVDCYELFSCSPGHALEMIESVLFD